jgi:hypothetical protein
VVELAPSEGLSFFRGTDEETKFELVRMDSERAFIAHTNDMSQGKRLKRWRGAMTRDQAVAFAAAECREAGWAWRLQRRNDARRAWRTWIVHFAVDDEPSGPWIHVDARKGVVGRVEHKPPNDRRLRLAASGLLVLMVLLMTAVFFLGHVCDDEVTTSGRVVSACRHLQATDPPVIAIGIVVLAAFGIFYSEISGFGISLKRRVDELDQTAQAGLQLAKSNREDTKRLDETTGDLADYNREVRDSHAPPIDMRTLKEDESPASLRVRQFAAQYNLLRGTMPSGDQRTLLMTRIVRDLRALLKNVPSFDVSEHLSSPDRGLRLAAFAYLVDHESRQHLSLLLEVAVAEDKPFGQYWALRAIRWQTRTTPRLNLDGLHKLEVLAQRAGPGTDRAREVDAILALERSKP